SSARAYRSAARAVGSRQRASALDEARKPPSLDRPAIAWRVVSEEALAVQAALLPDLFGNPFRPAPAMAPALGEPKGKATKARTVSVIPSGDSATAEVGDVIRVQGRVAAGQGDVAATVAGAGKLFPTSRVRVIANGRPLIGSSVTAFEVRAEKEGRITITVTTSSKVQGTKEAKEFTVGGE